ncbi:MAG: glycosyltransferase family 2 protein [Lachnospiraceae bacterium]|nr:glycosyltransferase family 2 protein [Lachnospiraceae bacterium]
MKIAVILVNYNGKQYNTACIDSLFAQTLHSENSREIRVYVVDNASRDDSMQMIQEHFAGDGRIEAIFLDDNYGFSYANNVGIRCAEEWGADYVLLLNNDTEADEDMMAQLIACAGRHPGSMIAPKIYYSDRRNVIWSAGGDVSPLIRKVRHIGIDQEDQGQFDEERQIGFATGCCLLIPKAVLETAGNLDERFFLYYEDTEYSFRLRKLQIPVYYCPGARVYHKVGASSKGADSPLCAYYIARNWLLCDRMYLGAAYPLFLLYFAVNRTICCMLWLLRGKRALVQATCRGIRDHCRRKYGRAEYYH